MRQRRVWARLRTAAAAALAATLAAALLTTPPVSANPAAPDLWSPFPLPKTPSVPVSDVQPGTSTTTPAMRSTAPKATTWPAATTATVDLAELPAQDATDAAAAGHPGLYAASTAPGTPVQVSAAGSLTAGRTPPTPAATAAAKAATTKATPSSVRVRVASRQAARAAGINGVIVSVANARHSTSRTGISLGVSYASIAQAFGGDYAARLHLVQLPSCALTHPTRAHCRTQTPVPAAANDTSTERLLGDVVLPASSPSGDSSLVLAATSGSNSGAGTYSATPLAQSGNWTVGNTGSFTYAYPITVPPSMNGDGPSIALTYNSASVDGRTSANNSQASWIGDGWDYSPGYIERSYRACSDDGQSGEFDQCWAGDNATISLNGKSTRLVPTGTGNKWRLRDDDGSVIDQVSGATNGLNGGTYWRLTTQDGTQYLFGANHLPTANGGTGSDAATNAAWGVPVFGNDSGEPCHGSTFDTSKCTQGWRWNLDFVINPHHNISVYKYKTETNYYAAGASRSLTSYVRGGVLTSILYGQQVTDYVTGSSPAAQIDFTSAQRCDPTGNFNCSTAISSSNASHWPDVPYDQNCASSGTCTNFAPTFWSQLALTTITTKVWDMSLTTPGWSTVDTYSLSHTYPDPGDLGQGGVYHAGKAMWLTSVQHTGSDTRAGGSAASLDKITFDGATALPNRVDGIENPSDIPPINRFRILALKTESGASIAITYDTASGTGCTRSAAPAEDNDATRCYPVRWTPQGYTDPILDWFYTYPVVEVDENDNGTVWGAEQSPAHITKYEYAGPAWHRDDSDITPNKNRTWGEFRGYHQMTVRTGVSPDPITQSTSFYLQGMDGDIRKDGSARSVSYTDSGGHNLVDEDPFANFSYQTTTYTESGGSAQEQTLQRPWKSNATATQAHSGLPDLVARFVNTDRVDTRQWVSTSQWRTSEILTTYDTTTGLPTKIDNKGEVDGNGNPISSSTTPEKCTTTSYASDPTRNMVDYVAQTLTNQGACTSSPNSTTLQATKTLYDKSTTLGELPGAGDATSLQQLKSSTPTIVWAAAASTTFDSYGRATGSTDPLGRSTTTSFGSTTAAKKYLPVTQVSTNPKGWQTTTTLDPGRQLPLTTTDVNGRTVTRTYDGLGRLSQVWLPNHAKANFATQPSIKFSYTVTSNTFVSVNTQTLRDNNTYGNDVKIYDALLQMRQEQSMPLDASAGARLISATRFDSHGWTVGEVQDFYNKDSAPTATPVAIDQASVPAETRSEYDGQARVTSSTLVANGAPQWSTTNNYPGLDRVDTTPPSGASPTTTITDARGQQIERRQYKGTSPSGDYDVAYFRFDSLGRQVSLVGPIAHDASPTTTNLKWTTTYDALGDPVKVEDPDSGTTTATYDDDREVVAKTDATNQTLSVDYDPLGRKNGIHNGGPTGPLVSSWTYDPAGAKGQLASSTTYASDGTTPTWSTTISNYDTLDQPITSTITIPAGTYGNTDPITYKTTNTYTPIVGNIDTTDITETGTGNLIGKESYGFSYNDAGLPVASGGLNTYESWTYYDPHGRVVRGIADAMPKQTVLTNNWDEPTGRLLNNTVSKEDADAAVADVSYTYNPAGKLTSATTVADGQTASADRECYTYDSQGRLTNVWTDAGGTTTQPSPTVAGVGACDNTDPQTATFGGPAPYWQSYSYDITGNRTSRTDHAVTGGASTDSTITEDYTGLPTQHAVHTVQDGDRLTTYAYDDAGRPAGTTTTKSGAASADDSQKLTWTPTGKLSSLTTGDLDNPTHQTGYGYDPDGNLVARTTDGTTTLYLGSDTITLTSGSAAQIDRTYSFPGGITAVRVATATGTSLHWQTTDPHDTATTDIAAGTLTASRKAYTPFGEARPGMGNGENWAGDRGFVGGTTDPVNDLTNLGAREYNPALGRFITPDDFLDPADPQQWNAYAYANNDPVNASDPDGNMVKGLDGLGHGSGTQADKAYKNYNNWVRAQNSIRHNIAVDVALSIIMGEVQARGGDPADVKTEYFIPGGGKNGAKDGRADIVYVAPDGTVYVWEVKMRAAAADGGDALAAREVRHYMKAIERAEGRHAVPGWKLGVQGKGIDPATGEVITVKDGGSPGSIIYRVNRPKKNRRPQEQPQEQTQPEEQPNTQLAPACQIPSACMINPINPDGPLLPGSGGAPVGPIPGGKGAPAPAPGGGGFRIPILIPEIP